MKKILLFMVLGFAVVSGAIFMTGGSIFSGPISRISDNAEPDMEKDDGKEPGGEELPLRNTSDVNAFTSEGEGASKEQRDRPEEKMTEAVIVEEEHFLVVIDPGHQKEQNTGKEPVGPGSSDMKQKVSSGTSGVSTGLDEYELNLEVSLKLRDELTKRGYEVIMVRETNDVDISNAERAEIANKNHADVFVRIHANGDDDHSVHGMLTICQTPDNPYNGDLYLKSRALAEDILDRATQATGAKRLYVWETDTMSGINWAQVPCTIVEMGYMSNPAEDERMSTDSYQDQIVEGISDGIDHFFDRAGS